MDYANKAAVTGVGYTAGEMPDLALGDVVPVPATETWGDTWEHLKREGTITRQTVMIRKDGTKMPVEMVLRYLEYHNNEFVCCFCRDISERTRMERTLHLANKKLNVLTSLTRHDIQNKVTVLLGYWEGRGKGRRIRLSLNTSNARSMRPMPYGTRLPSPGISRIWVPIPPNG